MFSNLKKEIIILLVIVVSFTVLAATGKIVLQQERATKVLAFMATSIKHEFDLSDQYSYKV